MAANSDEDANVNADADANAQNAVNRFSVPIVRRGAPGRTPDTDLNVHSRHNGESKCFGAGVESRISTCLQVEIASDEPEVPDVPRAATRLRGASTA